MSYSLAEQYALLPAAERDAMLKELSDPQINALMHDWEFWARPEQLEPKDPWSTWYIETGRGWGKTTTAANTIHKKIKAGRSRYCALVHRTSADVRDVMVEGKSGVLATAPPGWLPRYEPSKRKLTWPNGATATTYSAEEPDLLRGPEHDLGWGDEFPTYKHITGIDGATAFDNLRIGMRGTTPNPDGPQLILTGTPKRVPSVKSLHRDANLPGNPFRIKITKGSLTENIGNLDPIYIAQIMARYAGTVLGQQEIDGILASAVEGALWTEALLELTRVLDPETLPELDTPVVAVDPSSGDGTGDECGISVQALSIGPIPTTFQQSGLTVVRDMRHGYVLEDASLAGDPDAWANRVCEVAARWGTTTVVAEGNQGGLMVKSLLKARNRALRVKIVHARVNKAARAEPVAGLFSQLRWHIVGYMPDLEDQLTTWVPKPGADSPDRLDAMVWGATRLEPAAGRTGAVSYAAGALSKAVG